MVVCQKILLEKSSHFWKLFCCPKVFLRFQVFLQQFELIGYTIHYGYHQTFVKNNSNLSLFQSLCFWFFWLFWFFWKCLNHQDKLSRRCSCFCMTRFTQIIIVTRHRMKSLAYNHAITHITSYPTLLWWKKKKKRFCQ